MFEKTYDSSVWFGCNGFVVLFFFGFVVIITKHREKKYSMKESIACNAHYKSDYTTYRVCDTRSEILFKYSSISKQLLMHDVPICSQFIWLLHKVLTFSSIYPLSFYCLETWFKSKTKCTNIHHIQNRRTQNTKNSSYAQYCRHLQ